MRPKNDQRKMEVYAFVEDHMHKWGVCPTTSEIGEALGMAKSTVSKYMTRLGEEGLVERLGRYRTVVADAAPSYTRRPILGAVACGKPILAVEDVEGYLPIDCNELGAGEYFGLRAVGDSMVKVGISEGDVVYVRRQSTAENGDIVVAVITDEVSGDVEATLKRFYREKEGFVLHPENDKYDDIKVKELQVLGVAVRVLKELV